MRQIKFKGLTKGTEKNLKGIWVYGSFFKDVDDKTFILYDFPGAFGNQRLQKIEVIPESVGQFTGLHDKNGVEIYEGDMLKTEDSTYAYVVWEDAAFAMKTQGSEAVDWAHSSEYSYSEIIGNTHTQDGGQEG